MRPLHRPDEKRERLQLRRRGYSLLEAQASFVILSIAIAGVGPFVAYQVRQAKKLDDRFKGSTMYLVPSVNPWARKLGMTAQRTTIDPGAWTSDTSTPANNITILSVDGAPASEDATVHTQLN